MEPRIGKETGANWKDQEKCLEPKHRGITRAPKQGREEPLAVMSLVIKRGPDGVGAFCGKIETKAPVSTRNLRQKRENLGFTRLESPAGRA